MKFVSTALALLSVAGYVKANCNQDDLYTSCEEQISGCTSNPSPYDCIIEQYCICAKKQGCESAADTGLTGEYLEKFEGLCDLSNKKQTKPAPAVEEKDTQPMPAGRDKETKPAPPPVDKETKPAPPDKQTKPAPASKVEKLAPNVVKEIAGAKDRVDAFGKLDETMLSVKDMINKQTMAKVAKAVENKKQTKPAPQ